MNIAGFLHRRDDRPDREHVGIRPDKAGRPLLQPRLERAQAGRTPYPMADGAQQRALIAETSQIMKEAIAPVAKRNGPSEKLARARLSFDQGEMPISTATEEVCSPSKSASQTGAVQIA